MVVLTLLLVLLCICARGFGHKSFDHIDVSKDNVESKTVLKEILDYSPIANAASVVVAGQARFTVLTDHLIRMEYGDVEDRASLAFVHRRLQVPKFTSKEEDGYLHIMTDALHLTYKVNFTFSTDSLQIRGGNGLKWKYGDNDDGRNLHGTIRSLDVLGPLDLTCSAWAGKLEIYYETLHCTEGLISRSGWSVVDDSDAPRIDPKTGWWESPKSREGKYHDLYFFGHGNNYRQALKDFVSIGGRPAMVPRAALGVWFTRWYDYDEYDLEQDVIQEFAQYNVPMDVLVLDMNYHSKENWGTYSFDRHLLPEGLTNLKRKYPELLFSGNFHDNNGVHPYEDKYNDLADALSWENRNKTIPFAHCANSDYAFNVEDLVVEPLGFDIPWIDWQQGGSKGGCKGGKENPTIWLNRIRGLKNVRKGIDKRDIVLGRWGGLGNHRYQVGFSGDVDVFFFWDRLAYQPYFTITAANVAFGMWSHDITGPQFDPELTVRWIQWGALSPVLRFHDRGTSAGECDAWFPENRISNNCAIAYLWQLPSGYFQAARAIVAYRYRLLPYLYNAMREFYDTGLSPLHGLYYDYPDWEMSYKACDRKGNFSQYKLGPDMMVAPIVTKSNNKHHQLAEKNIWIPPGIWIEVSSGKRLIGEHTIQQLYDLEDVPIFVKAGSVIPHLKVSNHELFGVAGEKDYKNGLVFTLYLDESIGTGKGYAYLDDGTSMDYLKIKDPMQSSIILSYNFVRGTVSVTAMVPQSYIGKPFEIHLYLVQPILHAKIDNESDLVHSYDAGHLTSVVKVPGSMVKTNRFNIVLSGVSVIDEPLLGRINSCRRAKHALDAVRITPGSTNVQPGFLIQAGNIRARLNQRDSFEATVKEFSQTLFPAAKKEVDKMMQSARVKYAQALLNRY